VLTTVWGISSWFTQVTVAPTGTVTVCGPKLKLSILISAAAADGWSVFAATFDDPADNSSIAIIAAVAKLTTHAFFLVTLFFLSGFYFLA
jgi:hypothetical protein